MSSEKPVFFNIEDILNYANIIAEYEGIHPIIILNDRLSARLAKMVWDEKTKTYTNKTNIMEDIKNCEFFISERSKDCIVLRSTNEYNNLKDLYLAYKYKDTINFIRVYHPSRLFGIDYNGQENLFMKINMNIEDDRFILDLIKDIRIENISRVDIAHEGQSLECNYVLEDD